MKNRKGFTLVELLAVLALLSIILVIAVPVSITITQNAQRRSFENDIKSMIKVIQLEYETKSLNGYPCPSNSQSCSPTSNYKVLPKYSFGIDSNGNSKQIENIFGNLKIKGNVPSGGAIYLKSLNNNSMESGFYKKLDSDSDSNIVVGVSKLVSKDGKWCADKSVNSDQITIKKSSEDSACVQQHISN